MPEDEASHRLLPPDLREQLAQNAGEETSATQLLRELRERDKQRLERLISQTHDD